MLDNGKECECSLTRKLFGTRAKIGVAALLYMMNEFIEEKCPLTDVLL